MNKNIHTHSFTYRVYHLLQFLASLKAIRSLHVCACMYVCMYVRTCVYLHMSISFVNCVYICIYTQTFIYIYIYIYIHTYIHTYVYIIIMHAHVCAFTCLGSIFVHSDTAHACHCVCVYMHNVGTTRVYCMYIYVRIDTYVFLIVYSDTVYVCYYMSVCLCMLYVHVCMFQACVCVKPIFMYSV
jgi:hypothetical protein